MSDCAGAENPIVAETARPLFSPNCLSNRVDRLIKQINKIPSENDKCYMNIIQSNGKENVVESQIVY